MANLIVTVSFAISVRARRAGAPWAAPLRGDVGLVAHHQRHERPGDSGLPRHVLWL